jgi:hypothetical protein
MNYFYKATLTTISCAAIWTNQLMAYLPPITFESPVFKTGDTLGLNHGTGWSLLSGNASVSANGEGVGGGQALKLQVNPTQEPLLVRDIDWDAAQTVAFIDLKLKPAADPEGSLASFHSNGSQLAFQVPLGANSGNVWVYNGSSGITNPAQWAKTVLAPRFSTADFSLRMPSS